LSLGGRFSSLSFVSILYPLYSFRFCVSFQFFIHTFLCVLSLCWFDAIFVILSFVLFLSIFIVFCCFVICQNSHILFGTLSFVSFTRILSSVVLSFVILSSVILSFVVLSFVVLSFCLLLFCHFDFYLVLEKCLNFLIRTLESASDPALDVDNTGEVLALVHVSPGSSSLISRKTFAVRRALNPLALTLPFETNLMVMNFFLDLKLLGLFLPQSQILLYLSIWSRNR